MSKSVVLYTYALSPYGMKVYWALIFKKLQFQLQYVSSINQKEVAFTDQRMVPVVKINDDWRLDSGPICCWLDEIFPDHPISGKSLAERQAVIEADEWVSRNIIGLSFRSVIDNDTFLSAFRNGRILAKVMRKTSGQIPWAAQFIWVNVLRRAKFIIDSAEQVGRNISLAECRHTILKEAESRLESTGYLAGTPSPSYADISFFAQLAGSTTFNMEGSLTADSSQAILEYYKDMSRYFDLENKPPLVPGWQPFNFDC